MADVRFKKGIKHRDFRKLYLIIGALVVIGIVYMAFFSNSVANIVNPTQLNINVNQTVYFRLPDSHNTYAIFLKAILGNSATAYVSGMPVLEKPIIVLQMTSSSSYNISTSASAAANMHISMLNTSKSGASFEITPLLVDLGVKPSATIGVLQPVSFYGTLNYNGIQLTNTTNTQGGGSSTATTTVVTTTVAPTTTVQPANMTPTVLAGINATTPGILMKAYGALFAKDTACTSSIYNQSMPIYSTYHSAAKGPNDYYNATQHTPTSITIAVSNLHGTLYSALYTAHTPSATWTGPLANIQYDIGSNTIGTVTFEGLWQGLNYTQISANYNHQNSVPNACGALIP